MKALVLIDFQNEWLDKNSEYYIGRDISSGLEKVKLLISYARNNGYKIILTLHNEPEGEAFIAESNNSYLIDALQSNINTSDIAVIKTHISPFLNTAMDKHLKNVDEVIVAGILTNLCVRMFVEEAYDREIDITVVEDCCFALNDETHQFTLNDLKETRPEIIITSLDQLGMSHASGNRK